MICRRRKTINLRNWKTKHARRIPWWTIILRPWAPRRGRANLYKKVSRPSLSTDGDTHQRHPCYVCVADKMRRRTNWTRINFERKLTCREKKQHVESYRRQRQRLTLAAKSHEVTCAWHLKLCFPNVFANSARNSVQSLIERFLTRHDSGWFECGVRAFCKSVT